MTEATVIGSAELSDADLVRLTREGNTNSYGELWCRHATSARHLSLSITTKIDADDVVAEAFARIFAAILSDGGPTSSFRPYLFTTVRNVISGWGRSSRESSSDDLDQYESTFVSSSEDSAIDKLDQGLSAEAFRSLPDRWQEALWYSEIEQLPPRDIAHILGLPVTAVRALTFRAREGLRQAWIQAHLTRLTEDSPHRWTIERLGAYARGATTKRETQKIEEHLANCARCSVVAAEADNLGKWLALTILPLVVGFGAAELYMKAVRSGATATPASASSIPESVIRTAAQLAPQPALPVVASPVATVSTTWISSLMSPAIVTLSAVGLVLVAGLGVSVFAINALSPSAQSESVLPGNLPADTAVPELSPSAPTPTPGLTARIISDSEGIFFPVIRGTGAPGATVTIGQADTALSRVTIDSQGSWSTGQLSDSSIEGTLSLREQSRDGAAVRESSLNYRIQTPSISATLATDSTVIVVKVVGVPGAPVHVTSGNGGVFSSLAAVVLDANGVWSSSFDVGPGGSPQELSVRYAAGNRFGPSVTVVPSTGYAAG